MEDTFLFKETRIAWCAGLFEGEGSIFPVSQASKKRNYSYIRMAVKMTDLDVLERFHKFVGCGSIIHQTDKGVKKQPGHWKKHYYWQLSNKNEIQTLIITFWPYLGIRRRAKILELEVLKPE